MRQARTLLKHGINVVGAIIFGFDEDTRESLFDDTPKVLEKMGLTLLQPLICTPYPHLDYFKTLSKENRLITKEAKYYNGSTIVHKPKNIHPADLQEGFIKTRKKFFSWRSILKRMLKHNFLKFPEFLAWNVLYHRANYEIIPEVNFVEWLKYLKKL